MVESRAGSVRDHHTSRGAGSEIRIEVTMRHIEVSAEEYFDWIQWLLFAAVALLSGCASGPDWRPLAQFSDEAGIALTAAHKAHAESIERDTRARWHDCTSRPAGEVVECRRRAIDLAFDAYRPQGQALDKAIFTQRMLAATIETALLCKASQQPGDCEKVAFEQALKIYPEVRAFLIGLKKEREPKK